MEVPADAPAVCPVCDVAYESVSEHGSGVMVNLLENERYRRVCFEPLARDDESRLRFYHHTHEQTSLDHADEENEHARDAE